VLPKVSRKIVVDDKIRGLLPLLNLGTEAPLKGGN
jgi:hypothetical protein